MDILTRISLHYQLIDLSFEVLRCFTELIVNVTSYDKVDSKHDRVDNEVGRV